MPPALFFLLKNCFGYLGSFVVLLILAFISEKKNAIRILIDLY